MIIILRFLYWMLELFRQCDIFLFHFIIGYERKPAELQLLKRNMVVIVFVIKIVKVKYNRIDIKWWHNSTSFKIYLDILSYFCLTFSIFYYNTILMNTHKFWRDIQQTKWHLWEERMVLPFELQNKMIMYNCTAKEIKLHKEVNMDS